MGITPFSLKQILFTAFRSKFALPLYASIFKKAYKTPRLTGFLQKTGYLAPNRRGRNSFLQNAETR